MFKFLLGVAVGYLWCSGVFDNITTEVPPVEVPAVCYPMPTTEYFPASLGEVQV